MAHLPVTMKIRGPESLQARRAAYVSAQAGYARTLSVCAGAGCVSCDCAACAQALVQAVQEEGLAEKVRIRMTGCMGICDVGPLLAVEPDGVLYCRLKPDDMRAIVHRHLVEGEVVQERCFVDARSGQFFEKQADIPFFSKQHKVVLDNCGRIAYGDLDEYIAHRGFEALCDAVLGKSPGWVIEQIRQSGLRGRGGGGFPTGLKWQLARQAAGADKYVICNADEGDPGAFMDRSLLEGDPFLVIEGMALAGYAIGAARGVVYVRAEYPLAIERFGQAIEAARAAGLLGAGLFATDFGFDLEIRIGAGAFVCGEETALIHSVEGGRGEPRPKPPFPSDRGLYGCPTVINNVETFGNIAPILRHGTDWFAAIGTEKSKGTKIFALAGDVNNTGIVEVPMGITLGEILFDIGGGIPHGKRFKSAQTGGPSGGCLTRAHLNTPVDYQSLVELGAIMGSGGLIAMDEDTCMVDVARFFMEFVQDESCGMCVACRIGTRRMLDILERITRGQGQEGDIERLIELGETIRDTALCGLGQTAPNPVLSTIRLFREEYEEHIRQKYCRAGVCQELFLSPCENACPAGVNVPGYLALIAAGKPVDAYRLIRQDNPFPAICGRVCTRPCEARCRRAQVDEAVAIRDLKRYAADVAMAFTVPAEPVTSRRKGKAVAVIGAGPSGLSCAYYLGRLGYDVTVFEAEEMAGGMLACGIPEYRLPKAILQREIAGIEQAGVRLRLGVEIGPDLEFDTLRTLFDAIYVATGTQRSRHIGVAGEDLPGVHHGLDYLRNINRNQGIRQSGTVAVIGGGSTAMDAARVALRQGAREVLVLYRRGREDMPADASEIQEALAEGIRIVEYVEPLLFEGVEHVERVICQPMVCEGFDAEGRRRPVAADCPPVAYPVDAVILAVSQYSDLPFVRPDEVEVTRWGTFIVDSETLQTSMDGVFAGGDVVRGADIVIAAIADGKKAAVSIDRYLGGNGTLDKGETIEIPKPVYTDDIVERARLEPDALEPHTRIRSFAEVRRGYRAVEAVIEAERCLRCDLR